MAKTGYIALYRSLQDNPLWLEKPFSKGQAWADLLLSANHKDNTVILGNIPTVIKRGQYHTSELKLAERWGWSRKKVHGFIRLLEGLEMGMPKGTSKGTTITIVNYDDYQVQGTTKGTSNGTAKEHQKSNGGYKNNNDKNDNNDKETNKSDIYSIYCNGNKELLNAFKGWEEMRKKLKKPLTDRAKELSINALEKLSKNAEEQIQIIEYAILKSWQSFYMPPDLIKKKEKKEDDDPHGIGF